MANVTITTLMKMKEQGEKIAMLTSYDASFTVLAEAAGVDTLLIGDSLGMVVQGRESTLPVKVEDIVYHTANVTRVSERALVIADMPFMSHGTPEQALETAGLLMKEGGAHMVKLEGGAPQVETVRHLTQRAVPVCAHLGLLPQSIHQLGGYRVQGRSADARRQLLNDAQALQDAGAQMLVLECIPQDLAAQVTAALKIPVIGIGAGKHCDGQVLVIYDMLGITPGKRPSFSQDFLGGRGSVAQALAAYVQAVRSGEFPAAEHCFT
jgi:3-methyl-2-oxobutanoate hydroxymethyltransferase